MVSGSGYSARPAFRRPSVNLLASAGFLNGSRPSVPNRKFAPLRLGFGLSVVHAEALDRGEDVVGRFGPPERLWVGIVLFDECGDGGFQRDDAAVNSTSELAFAQQSEEAFDLVEPRGAGWR